MKRYKVHMNLVSYIVVDVGNPDKLVGLIEAKMRSGELREQARIRRVEIVQVDTEEPTDNG